jgi:hypothetical protein
MKDAGFPDKEPSAPPPIRVSVYGTQNPPAAATFNKGARTIQEIEEATQARRDNQRPGNIGRKE